MSQIRETLENRQVVIYFCSIVFAAVVAFLVPGTSALDAAINPALALMLFVTFLQVPLADLRRAFTRVRFLGALMVTNFLVVPLLVALLVQLLPDDPMIRLGLLMVLLTPCIDYVVTFAHLGRADAKLLLASTPALLIAQMILLPVYLRAFLGADAANLVHLGPFFHAFIWLIAVPLVLAAAVQLWAARSQAGNLAAEKLGLFPVPATALVLFVVVAAMFPQLRMETDAALRLAPLYVVFAVAAPILGWMVARIFSLEVAAGRAVAFSAGTRNSLVILPLALAVPGAIPVLPAIIITQTIVELISELIYIRLIPKLGGNKDVK